MLGVIDTTNAKPIMDAYYRTLGSRGYVNRNIVKRYIFWLFLMSFVDNVYYLLGDDDYNQINDVLNCLLSANRCLIPYEEISSRARVQESVYYETFSLRKAENDMLRKSQGEELRRTEI